MPELYYTDNNYVDFVSTCARLFNAKAVNGYLAVPENYGSGHMSAFTLTGGISVLVADVAFKEDFFWQRNATPNHQFFILQVNEITGGKDVQPRIQPSADTHTAKQSIVQLGNSFTTSKLLLPALTRMRTVKLIFEKQHLINLLGQDAADKFVAGYFSLLAQKSGNEAIDAGYRSLLHELLTHNSHPLKNTFLQNRVLLLLERFLLNFIEKLQPVEKAVHLKEEEMSRLIKVEALLVSDFALTPPTIELLAKISAMSPTKLKKDFKTLYGMPVYEYYQKNRMYRAKALLQEEKYAIKQVGTMVGYTNLGHFAASFKKEFGILPSELFNVGKADELVGGQPPLDFE